MMQPLNYTMNCLGNYCREYAQFSDDKKDRMGFKYNLFLDTYKE